MKVLLVIPYFMPAISYGGPVTVSYDLARGLVARGHEVTVATTDVLDDRSRVGKREELIDGIKVLRFRNVSNYLAKKFNGYLPLLFIPWLIKNCGRFDVVHCHDFFSLQAVATGLICKLRKIPLLLQPHGSLSAVRRSARFAGVKKVFIRFLGWGLSSAQNIIALTRAERDAIAALVPARAEKIVIIPNGLDLRKFEKVAKIDLHARYNIPASRRIIGFIGRLAYIKGIDISLAALATIRERADFSFLIIGPDEGELAKLKQQAAGLGIGERLIFAGMLGGEEKLRVMKSCDLFLFTSRDEGLPMTVLEVAALGVPQVISRECNVPELAEYLAGFVHPFDDIAGFAESIVMLLNDAAVGRVMALNARLLARERFSTDKMVDGVEQLMLGNSGVPQGSSAAAGDGRGS